ncbi:MAG: Gfo/Idh/MocA family oxidoreductase [Chloroflexota bacterium]|nr:Gfo/Idh/MocA family oxidoreductase [Chloroflexota bacterium]
MDTVVYNINAERRIKVGQIGCGWHPYMNLLPSFRYAPIDLVATCDVDLHRAEETARLFGGQRAYTDYRELLASERELDAVVVVTNYLPDGRPRYPEIATAALEAGLHVWMEKPPGSSLADVIALEAASERAGKFVQVGVKKGFYPTIERMREISRREEFGGLVSLYATYPLRIPPADQCRDLRAMRSLLDVLWHPAGAIHYIGGDAEYLTFRSAPNGGGVALFVFKSGAVGVLHMTGGEPHGIPAITLEWMEVVGANQSLLLDNNVRLTWYRKPTPPPGGYQRATTFIGDDEGAARYWEPEMSRGTVYNSNHMLSGYALELNHFAQAVLTNRPPSKGNLEQCEEIMAWFEAFQSGPEGERISIPALRRRAAAAVR